MLLAVNSFEFCIFFQCISQYNKVMACRITAVQTALALFSRQYRNASYRDIANDCAISKSSAARICVQKSTEKKMVDNAIKRPSTKSNTRRGRPRKVSDRSVRKLIRTLKDIQNRNVHITVKSVVEKNGLSLDSYLHTRKESAKRKLS